MSFIRSQLPLIDNTLLHWVGEYRDLGISFSAMLSLNLLLKYFKKIVIYL